MTGHPHHRGQALRWGPTRKLLSNFQTSRYTSPEFPEIFKVAVDIEEDVDRTPELTEQFAHYIAGIAKREATRPLDAGAVARVVDHAARLAADSEKLSCHTESFIDILCESDYWAGKAGKKTISTEHIQQSIDAQIHRADRVRERTQEAIRRGTILIDTTGAKTGQVNGIVRPAAWRVCVRTALAHYRQRSAGQG